VKGPAYGLINLGRYMPVTAWRAGRRPAWGGLGQLGWYRGSSRPYGV